jgi:hypothetical protein
MPTGVDIATGNAPGRTGGNSQPNANESGSIDYTTVDAGSRHKQIPMEPVDPNAGLNDQYQPNLDSKRPVKVPFMSSQHDKP